MNQVSCPKLSSNRFLKTMNIQNYKYATKNRNFMKISKRKNRVENSPVICYNITNQHPLEKYKENK